MEWILTFILGYIGGAVGAVMFIVWYGRRASKKAMYKAVVNARVDGVMDSEGNLISKDDPRYQEAMAAVHMFMRNLESQEETDNSDDKAE